MALNAFRIMQEACTNAIKHAQPTKLSVKGCVDKTGNWLQLSIEDNVTGLDPAGRAKGYGLVNMEKRAAEMQGNIAWLPAPGMGTTVVLRWPISMQHYTAIKK